MRFILLKEMKKFDLSFDVKKEIKNTFENSAKKLKICYNNIGRQQNVRNHRNNSGKYSSH